MISKLFQFGKPKKAERKSNLPIVMVALEKNEAPSFEVLLQKLADYPGIDLGERAAQDQAQIFDWEGDMITVAFMPGPIPWSDLEGPCATAWHWPEATERLKDHAAHLLIAVLPHNEAKDDLVRVMQLTKLVGEVCKSIPALGVYWAAGTLVQPPGAYIDFLEVQDDRVPLELWVEFRLQANPDGTANVLTTGMGGLGHMELEVINSKKDLGDIFEFVYNIATYLVKQGPVIKDGDTVGNDADHIIKVKYQASVWQRPEKVMRIAY